MGGGKAGFNINRSEFSHENALDGDIEYQRGGGCFVTTKKAIFLAILAILALIAVGAFIYFYGSKHNKTEEENSSDLEKLLNDSLYSTDGEDIRLPSRVHPLHYRLRIHPYLEESTADSFTFTGQVTILIQCTKSTKRIVLHSEDLQIAEQDVTVGMIKNLRLTSLSQIAEIPETNLTAGNAQQTNFVPANPVVPELNTEVKNLTEPLPNQQPPAAVINPAPILSVTTSSVVPNVIGISTPAADPITSPAPFLQPSFANSNTTSPEVVLPPSFVNETKSNNNQNESFETRSVPMEKIELTTIIPPTEPNNVVYQAPETAYVNIKRLEEIKQMSRYVIHLVNALEVGKNYTVDIKFSGKILNNLVGLYKTNYLDNEGHKRWLLTTQFQPVFARRVFPCFDEPTFKSIFEISIARRTNMSALSNMPLKESEPMANHSDWVWDHFQKSPPMSSYLVAFTVFDFENLKPAPGSELYQAFKIWAPKNSLLNAQYAMEIGPKIFTYLQNYFGIKYPLPKVDLIAIPELSQTAMENWGLITFRDTALLLDPQADSWETRNHIFKTIAGKLAKQWFGDLVTMHWWSDFWLSEGFSTYMEDAAENAIEPTLEDLDTFALRITQTILDSDKLKSVRSLHVDIKDPTQIEQLFDDVASNKGSCLIRMLNYTLTEPLFKEVIQKYLRTWMYKCSTQGDLWDSFTQIAQNKTILPSDLSVKDFMNSWIKQEGFPVVTVTRTYETGGATITQNRFVHGNDTHGHLWYIPLTYTRENENGAVSTIWMKTQETAVNLTQPGHTWVIVNADGAGLYRVNYDNKNWELLRNQLMNDSAKISPSNRGQILNDAFELANVGLLNYEIAFELTKYLAHKERNYIPWYSLFNSLKQLQYVMASTQYNGLYQQYILNIIKPIYEELGTAEKPGESQNNKLLRNMIVKVACSINYGPCLEWAQQKYQEWRTSPEPDKINPIPFELREVVQCSAIKMGGQREWNFLWERTLYSSISPINLKVIYLSLGCTREPWLINSYLEKSINGSIALHNVRYVWQSIAHPVGLNVGFSFLRTNWQRIYTNYQHIFSNFNSIFEDFLSRLSTKVDLEDLTIFYKNQKEHMYSVSSLMLNVVERIKWRISWTDSHMHTVTTWLLQNN